MAIKSNVGDMEKDLMAREVEPFLNEFEFSQTNKGISILEIFVNGEQIPESPIQVQVIDRDCEAEYPGTNRISLSILTPKRPNRAHFIRKQVFSHFEFLPIRDPGYPGRLCLSIRYCRDRWSMRFL